MRVFTNQSILLEGNLALALARRGDASRAVSAAKKITALLPPEPVMPEKTMLCLIGQSTENPPLQTLVKWWEYVTRGSKL